MIHLALHKDKLCMRLPREELMILKIEFNFKFICTSKTTILQFKII